MIASARRVWHAGYGQSTNNKFTSLQLQRMVILQTGRATRYGAVGLPTGCFFPFRQCPPSLCPSGSVPPLPSERRDHHDNQSHRSHRIVRFIRSFALCIPRQQRRPSRRQGPASSRSIRRLHSRRWHRHHQFRRRRSQHYVRPGDGRFAWRRGSRFT
jgi:hypothetical protein